MAALTDIENRQSSFETFVSRVQDALGFFDNPELARRRLRFYRWKATEELDKNLLEFESGVKRTGGNVLWGNEVSDTLNTIKSLLEANPKVAFVEGKIASEVSIASNCNIPTLPEFRREHTQSFPDLLFVQAKFLVSASGHIYYCTENKEEFEATSNAKHLFFLAGIDSIINNGLELELAKNLYSAYELGQFGYSLELLTKPGKPDNRFSQQVSILVADHGRSNLLESELDRRFFPLLNFELAPEIAELFWGKEEGKNALQHHLTDPMMNEATRTKKFLFSNNGYNRLSGFFPFHLDIYDYFMQARLTYMDSSKTNFLLNLTKTNYAKAFLEPKTKMPTKKFIAFIKEKLVSSRFRVKSLPEKTFIEKYYYDKRKI